MADRDYTIVAPDGRELTITGPADATPQQLRAAAEAAFVKMPPPKADAPVAVQAGNALRDIPRQLGLTARYGLEGAPALVDVLASPFKLLTDAATGTKGKTASEMGKGAADWLGLPEPRNANERVVGDVTRLMAGGGGAAGAGKLASTLPGIAGQAGQFFGANPLQQVVSAGGAGAAGGAVREAGGGPWEQAGAALLGGVAAPSLLGAAQSGVQRTGNVAKKLTEAIAPGTTTPQNVDQTISLVLQRSGVDWGQVPERVRQTMRTEVSEALRTGGDLDPAALNRLLAFARTGTTPTRGMLSQDPVQLTREKNLAKTGANSTDLGLQRLPRVENDNAKRLLTVLDEQGAKNAPDDFATGKALIDVLKRQADGSKTKIDSLYQSARDTQGRSALLDGPAAMRRANEMLVKDQVGKLPAEVDDVMNAITKGETPLTVDYQQQLLKNLYRKMRGAGDNGDLRHGLGIVRSALDDAPVLNASAMGEESVRAFGRARQANAAFMKRVEDTPALKAVMDGVEPDKFVKQYITGSSATVADVNQIRKAVASDPKAMEAVRGNIAQHLKSAATNATEDVTKFSPVSYNKALNAIGERKLAAFFSPDEIATLRDVGRAGTYMTAQPVGSAVNNSNSGALVIARGLELLDKVAGRLPFGVNDTIQGTLRGMQQGQALSAPKALLSPAQRPGLLQGAAPATVYSGLLGFQPVD